MLAFLAVAASTSFMLPPISTPLRPAARNAATAAVRMQDEPPAPENLGETATAAMDSIMQMLSDEAEPPKNLIAVKNAVSGGDALAIGEALYLLLAEQALDYDMKDGMMYPTAVDYSNTDDEKVREKMAYIYQYGISMLKRGYISQDALMDAVLTKIASRVGMTGEQFDQWLAIPKVEL